MKFDNQLILNSLILGLFILLSGCVSGPKDNGRSLSERLNSANYESSNSVLGVPILERKPVLRKLSGHVFCGTDVTQTPANHATVNLKNNKQIINTTSTDPVGYFVLSTPMDPELSYELQVTSSCGHDAKILSQDLQRQPNEMNIFLQK